MKRGPSLAQEVFLKVESAGKIDWKIGLVVECTDDKYRIAVKLGPVEKGSEVFVAGGSSFGLVLASGGCLMTHRPHGFTEALPKANAILTQFFRLDLTDDEVPFLSASESGTAEQEVILRLEREKAELVKQLALAKSKPSPSRSGSASSQAMQRTAVAFESDEGEEESEEDGEERGDLDDLLSGMEKLWGSAAVHKKAEEEHPGLEEEIFGKWSTPKAKARATTAPAKSSSVMGSGKLDMRDLVMLEMMNMLRQMKRNEGDLEDPISSLSSNQSRSISRSMQAFRQMRNRVRDDPKGLIRRYVEEVKDELGVTQGQVWSLRDYSKRINWGKFRSFQKMFEMQIAVWELLQKGESLQAWAQVTQNLKALHQVTLDQGNWRHAWPISGLADPAERRRFGGHAEEMETVNQFVKTMEELDKRIHTKAGEKGDEV